MLLYVPTWLSLLTITLTAAIFFSVASVIRAARHGGRKPLIQLSKRNSPKWPLLWNEACDAISQGSTTRHRHDRAQTTVSIRQRRSPPHDPSIQTPTMST